MPRSNYPPYDEFAIVTDYFSEQGLIMCPVMGPPGTPVEIMRVHSGYSTKRVDWKASRLGAKPDLPAPETGTSNETLVCQHIRPQAPGVDANGMNYHSVSGTYEYFVTEGYSSEDPLVCGTTPFSDTPGLENTIDPDDFSQLLVGVGKIPTDSEAERDPDPESPEPEGPTDPPTGTPPDLGGRTGMFP